MLKNYGRCVVKTFSEIKITIAPTPADATVVITATGFTQSGNSIIVFPGTSITYTVSKIGYFTTTNTVTVYNNQTINVALEEAPYLPEQVVFESSTPGSYTLNLLAAGTYRIICVGGGGGAASVSSSNVYAGGTHTAVAVGSGGSGGYSQNELSLLTGDHYIQVGSGGNGASGYGNEVSRTGGTGTGSSFDGVLIANPGGGGYAYARTTTSSATANATAGAGGTGSTTNGNAGNTAKEAYNGVWTGTKSASGGASVYGGYGKGGNGDAKGGNSNPTALGGGAGYVKVVFVSY